MSIALVLVLAVAIPAFAATTCPTANTSPINSCLAKVKLTASDIGSIREALKACGLNADVLQYGPVCETGDCTTPDCTKINCDGTECVTTDCAEIACGNTGSTSDEQLNACTEADCANNGCDAADCKTAGCKDTCAQTKCIPAAEEPAEESYEPAIEPNAPAEKKETSVVKAVVADKQDKDSNAAIDEALEQGREAAKSDAYFSNCPQTDDGSADVKSQLQDAVNKALEQAKSKASSNANCPTGSSNSANIEDAVNKALDQARAQVSSGSNCPTGGSVDVNGILNQLQNGLSNCNK